MKNNSALAELAEESCEVVIVFDASGAGATLWTLRVAAGVCGTEAEPDSNISVFACEIDARGSSIETQKKEPSLPATLFCFISIIK